MTITTDPTFTNTHAMQPHKWSATYGPLLGTMVDISVTALALAEAQRAERVIRGELSRLEQVFDASDETSPLNRWMTGRLGAGPEEFDELLAWAMRWQLRSGGAFNVGVRRLRHLWARAAAEGCRPSVGELHELAHEIGTPPFRFDGHVLRQITDCSHIELTSIARGYSLDRAIEAARRLCDVTSITVRAGDDVTHVGPQAVAVPLHRECHEVTFAPPSTTIEIISGTLTRTGSTDRGAPTDDKWTGDVLDPRTGLVVSETRSVAVLAAEAMTARVVAAILNVMTVREGLAFVAELNTVQRTGHPSGSLDRITRGAVCCWITDGSGRTHRGG